MFRKIGWRWYVAAGQTGIAGLLSYWHVVNVRALGDFVIWDFWDLPSALLVIFDWPAVVFMFPLFLLGISNPYTVEAVNYGSIFFFWVWALSPFEKPDKSIPDKSAALPGRRRRSIWLAVIVGLITFLLVPTTIGLLVKITAAMFWAGFCFLRNQAKNRCATTG